MMVLCMASVGARADAPRRAPGARPITLEERLLLRAQWEREMLRERVAVRVWPSAVGIAVGLGVLGGATLLAVNIDRKGGILTGVMFGVPITVVSTLLLAKRLKRRRAIDRELSARRPRLQLLVGSGLGFRF